MTIKSGFFNSSSGDRKYDALDLSSIFDGIIEDGVFATLDNQFAVKPGTGMQVTVDTGKAWFNHTWTVNDAILPLTIEAADITLDRYDAVVLEVNNTDPVRRNDIKIVKGTPAGIPKKPTLVNETDVHQHALAYILVGKGVTSIEARFIEIVVGKSETPFVTGPLKTVPIDELFAQWESEFDYWFENLKGNLEGDVAANLQKQIDERVKIADRATNEELATGINENKWVSAKGLKDAGFDAAFRVGDTCTTLRSDLGERWALCNGDPFDTSLYPEFSKLLPPTSSLLSGGYVVTLTGASAEYYTQSTMYADDDYQIAVLDGVNSPLTLDVSTDNFKTKKNIKPSADLDNRFGAPRVSKFSDGTYVGVVFVSDIYPRFQVITTKNPLGTWTLSDIIALPAIVKNAKANKVLDIWDRNGVYYIAVAYDDTGYAIVSSQTPNFSNPTSTSFRGSSGDYTYITNYIRLATKHYAVDYNSNLNRLVRLYEHDADSPSIRERTISITPNKQFHPRGAIVLDGAIIFAGDNSAYSGQEKNALYYVANPSSGSVSGYMNTFYNNPNAFIKVRDELWVLPQNFKKKLAITEDYKQQNSWSEINFDGWGSEVTNDTIESSQSCANNSSHLFIVTAQKHLICIPMSALPVIDSAPLRTFIKVKE